jgi:hypothetical protein
VADATSYMGLASLDLRAPLYVRSDCSESQFDAFRHQAAAFAVE